MKNIIPSENINALKSIIARKPTTVITSHINPDGDAIGSSLAWAAFLEENGIKPIIIVPNKFPENFYLMNGSRDVVIYCDEKEKAQKILADADLLFCMDFNNTSRLEDMGKHIDTLNISRVLIDHHLNPSSGFQLSFSFTSVSSTAELVYRIIIQYTESCTVSEKIAEHIYTGIITDTKVFSHNVSPDLFRLTANLLECGINRDKIHGNMFRNASLDGLKLNSYAIYERMVVMPEYNAAYICLTNDELNRFNYKPGDTEGLVNIPLDIKGIMISAFFTETQGQAIKVSLRSVGDFSVNDMSGKYFNGGGHKNAAGGKLFTDLNGAKEVFIKALKESKSVIEECYNKL